MGYFIIGKIGNFLDAVKKKYKGQPVCSSGAVPFFFALDRSGRVIPHLVASTESEEAKHRALLHSRIMDNGRAQDG